MKFCTNCGLQVSSEVSFCPRCGAFIPQVASSSSSNSLTSSETQSPGAENEPGAMAPSSPQQPLYLSTSPLSSKPSTTSSPSATYQPIAYPPYTPPPSPMVPPTPPIPPTPRIPPPPRPNRGMSSGMIVLSAALAVIVLLGGIALILYAAVLHPAQLHADATATVQAILASDASATAIANMQATGTAVAQANATATAQTQATVQAQATATALQAIYTQATLGTPALSSSLSGQDGFNWDQYQTTDGGGCSFTGGALHATLFSQHFYVPCFAQSSNFSNFAFQVQMTINKGDEGGLVFRADDQNAKFYLFTANHDGSYSLYLSKDNNHNQSIAYGNTSLINKNYGQSNLLTVIARGSTIYLYINKHYLTSVNDGTYTSGKIGIFASDNTNNTDVSFNNAQVWKF